MIKSKEPNTESWGIPVTGTEYEVKGFNWMNWVLRVVTSYFLSSYSSLLLAVSYLHFDKKKRRKIRRHCFNHDVPIWQLKLHLTWHFSSRVTKQSTMGWEMKKTVNIAQLNWIQSFELYRLQNNTLIHARFTCFPLSYHSNWFSTQRNVVLCSPHKSFKSISGDQSEFITGDQSECFSSPCLISCIRSQLKYQACWHSNQCNIIYGGQSYWYRMWHRRSLKNSFLCFSSFRKPAWPGYEYPRQEARVPSSTASAMACSMKLLSSR